MDSDDRWDSSIRPMHLTAKCIKSETKEREMEGKKERKKGTRLVRKVWVKTTPLPADDRERAERLFWSRGFIIGASRDATVGQALRLFLFCAGATSPPLPFFTPAVPSSLSASSLSLYSMPERFQSNFGVVTELLRSGRFPSSACLPLIACFPLILVQFQSSF